MSLNLKEGLQLIGGAEGGRTPDLRIANAALCQTELLPHVSCMIEVELRDSQVGVGEM